MSRPRAWIRVRRTRRRRRTLSLAAARPIGDARPMPIHEAAMWSAYQQTRYVVRLSAGVRPDSGAAAPADRRAARADECARAGEAGDAGDEGGDGEVSIRVGGETPALDRLVEAHGARTWCFVTAANPGSVLLGEAENLARNAVLQAELSAAGFVVLEGEGRAERGGWPVEPSFLVIGADRVQATELGARHGQNAVVFGERGGRAELIDCRGRPASAGGAVLDSAPALDVRAASRANGATRD